MNGNQTEYMAIAAKQDVDLFLDRTNGLHDGYILSVQYVHRGHSGGNPHWIDPALSELKVRIMVTSIRDAVVELVFEGIVKWQIYDDSTEILDTAISFTEDGNVIWADDTSTDPAVREQGSYVIAAAMKWRFV